MKAYIRELISRHWQLGREMLGYLAVSGTALCVDVTIYWSLLGFVRFAFAAAVGGYVFGVLTHYALSSRVVFRHRFDKRGVVEEAPTVVKFFAAGLTGLTVTALVVGIASDVLGVNPLIAKVIAAGCSFLVVFTMLRVFVFDGQSQAKPVAA